MSQTILVTGGTGLVSSAVVDELLAVPNVAVRVLVRDETKGSGLKARGVQIVTGDLGDPRSLPSAFEGVTRVWSLVPLGPGAAEQSSNITWAARQAGVQGVVRMSAFGAAGDAPTRNGRLHALSDQELQGSGLEWTIVRPLFFMQNLLAAAPFIAEYGVFQLGMANGRLGMVDTRDIAAVAARLLTTNQQPGKIFTVTGPAAIDLNAAADAIGRAVGKPVRYEPVSSETLRSNLASFGMPQWIVDALVEYNEAYATDWGAVSTAVVADIVGRPARSIDDFARDFASSFSVQ